MLREVIWKERPYQRNEANHQRSPSTLQIVLLGQKFESFVEVAMRLLFFILQKISLACRECATLQTRYPLWSASPPIRHLSTHRAALWVWVLNNITSTKLSYAILVMVNILIIKSSISLLTKMYWLRYTWTFIKLKLIIINSPNDSDAVVNFPSFSLKSVKTSTGNDKK